MDGFVIHALPLSGGILAIAPLPGRDGRYEQDLEHIRDWKPALVISMTTPAEMAAAGAQDLGAHLQDAGTRWVHLPIADFTAPGAEQEASWHATSRTALAALHGGGRVLIHCRMGKGRSGMAALRLMIEIGERPTEALQRIRSVHPMAIETHDQMTWALTT